MRVEENHPRVGRVQSAKWDQVVVRPDVVGAAFGAVGERSELLGALGEPVRCEAQRGDARGRRAVFAR